MFLSANTSRAGLGPSSLLSSKCQDLFLQWHSSWNVKLTTYLHLVPTLRKPGILPPFLLCFQRIRPWYSSRSHKEKEAKCHHLQSPLPVEVINIMRWYLVPQQNHSQHCYHTQAPHSLGIILYTLGLVDIAAFAIFTDAISGFWRVSVAITETFYSKL